MKTIEWLAVGGICRESFEALEIKCAAVNVVCARFRDDVDDSARSASKLSARSSRNNLKLFHCLQRDVDCGALSAELFAEEAVVVVTAIETDVIKDSALAREIDLIAVRTLRDADVGRECQQIFKLSSQDGCSAYRSFVQCRAGFSLDGIYGWSCCDGDGFSHR